MFNSIPIPKYSGLYFLANSTALSLYFCFVSALNGRRSSPSVWVKNWTIPIGSQPYCGQSSEIPFAPLSLDSSCFQSPDQANALPPAFTFSRNSLKSADSKLLGERLKPRSVFGGGASVSLVVVGMFFTVSVILVFPPSFFSDWVHPAISNIIKITDENKIFLNFIYTPQIVQLLLLKIKNKTPSAGLTALLANFEKLQPFNAFEPTIHRGIG